MANSTEIHTYPIDISTLPHSMIFYVNVDTESKFYKEEDTKEIERASSDIQNRMGTGFTQARGAQYGKELVNKLKNGLSQNETITKATKFVSEKTSGVVETVKSNDIAKSFFKGATAQFTKKMKRLETAIVLPIPKSIVTNYGVGWKDENMGSGIGSALLENASASQAQSEMNGQFVSGMAGEIIGRNLAKMGAKSLNVSDKIVELKTRKMENPRKEQLFEGVAFREFDFSWVFYPNNYKEMQNIQRIIKMFKFHMMPELTNGNYFYIYPSEFDMEFQFNGTINKNLPKISTCVLANVAVEYTPDKEFVTTSDGQPNGIGLTLKFKETEILHKQRIEDGY